MTSKACDLYTLLPKPNTAVADLDLAGSFTDNTKLNPQKNPQRNPLKEPYSRTLNP